MRTRFLTRCALLCASFGLLGGLSVHAAPPAARLPGPHVLDLDRYLHGYDAGVYGLLDRNTLLTSRAPSAGAPSIDLWDVRTGKIRASIWPPTPVSAGSLGVSPDGRTLVGIQGIASYLPHPVFNTHVLYVWDLGRKKLVRTIDFGQDARVFEWCFLPGRKPQIVVTEDPVSGPANFPRFLILDYLTGRPVRAVRDRDATNTSLSQRLFSPDGGTFFSVWSAGEGDLGGGFRVLSARSFRRLYALNGTPGKSVIDSPASFVSAHTVLMGSLLYDTRTRRFRPALPGHRPDDIECLCAVPGTLRRYLFSVQVGKAAPTLELWDVAAGRCLRRWRLPSSDQEAFAARDGRAFGLMGNDQKMRVYDCDLNAPPVRHRQPGLGRFHG